LRTSHKKSAAVDTGNLRQSISYEANGKTISVYANAKYAPYVEFGTGGMYDSSDMQQLGIPESYASQFRGDGKKNVNLPPRPFFFSAVRVEYKKLFDRISKKIEKRLK
jgi:HK97 gp10 family phage protein